MPEIEFKNSDKFRGWCFTINNWTEDDYERVKTIPHDYLILGQEIAPTTGTPHLQGYVYRASKLTFLQMKKYAPRGNFRVARGNAEENRAYCSEDGKFEEFGECPQQGRRNDLEVTREILRGTGRIRDVVETATSMTQIKFAETAIKYIEPKREFKPHVTWIYGRSGVGKSRTAYDLIPNCYRKTNSSGQWWDGYDAHEEVLLDDLKYDNISYSTLLELLDRYECRVQFKGGSRQFLAKKIVITSIESPEELFRRESSELLRRIDKIIFLEEYKQHVSENERNSQE